MTAAANQGFSLWTEWGRITRFLESSRLAFARERNLWGSLELENSEAVKLKSPAGQGAYNVELSEHLKAIGDEETLYSSVLITSYALAEYAALRRLGLNSSDVGGIDDWGKRLLVANGRSWLDVMDGLPGIIELAVVRNVFAHGTRTIDSRVENRLSDANAPHRSAGSVVTLSYEELQIYRNRLRSLLRVGAL